MDESGFQESRRRFLACFSSLGLTSTLLPGVLWSHFAQSGEKKITRDMIIQAEKVAGLEFTEDERELMLNGLNEQLEQYERLRTVSLSNSVSPVLRFDPRLPGSDLPSTARSSRMSPVQLPPLPENLEDVAFWSARQLAEALRLRRISSVDLTRMYLERLKRLDPKLECVITLAEELALRQARRADEEIRRGQYRGPLHGLPWGAKDLLAAKGYPTTWGAMPYKGRTIDENATVVERLEQAGAVLVGKLTLGALAWGDVWFGGKTKTPWDLNEGSSGSSAGSAAATAAGLVGFAIGSETWGSIVSPCTRCGVTGLRPTFGRVSRHGAMALSWSMDKIGPIARSVEDCALVFDAIYGPDGKDETVIDLPFNWDVGLDIKRLRIGFVETAFEERREEEQWKTNDGATLESLRSLGLRLEAIRLPDYPVEALSFILNAEAAAAFDDLTRTNRDDLLVRQIENAWPNRFRQSRFIPAVEYIQANRVRRLVMEAMAELMSRIDVYVVPSYGGNNLLLTNLTGHPCVVLPNGFTEKAHPTSITFIGKLYGEAELLAVAKAYQDATDFHLHRPPV